MENIVILVQDSPYLENKKAWDALRFIGALLASDVEVKMCLIDRGVELGRRDHNPGDGYDNLEVLLSELIECGLTVSACGKSMNDLGVREDQLIEGVVKGSMNLLADWVKGSKNVLAF